MFNLFSIGRKSGNVVFQQPVISSTSKRISRAPENTNTMKTGALGEESLKKAPELTSTFNKPLNFTAKKLTVMKKISQWISKFFGHFKIGRSQSVNLEKQAIKAAKTAAKEETRLLELQKTLEQKKTSLKPLKLREILAKETPVTISRLIEKRGLSPQVLKSIVNHEKFKCAKEVVASLMKDSPHMTLKDASDILTPLILNNEEETNKHVSSLPPEIVTELILYQNDENQNNDKIMQRLLPHLNKEQIKYLVQEIVKNEKFDLLKHLDQKTILKLVKVKPLLLEFASEACKKDKNIAKAAIFQNPSTFLFLHEEAKDRDVRHLFDTRSKPNYFENLTKEDQSNPLLIEAALKCNSKNEIAITAARHIKIENLSQIIGVKSYNCLEHLSRGVFLQLVKSRPLLLEFGSEAFKQDKQIVRAAILENPDSLKFVDKTLLTHDKDEMTLIMKYYTVRTSPEYFKTLTEKEKNNRGFIEAALKCDPNNSDALERKQNLAPESLVSKAGNAALKNLQSSANSVRSTLDLVAERGGGAMIQGVTQAARAVGKLFGK